MKPLVRSESGCYLESLHEDDFLNLGPNETEHGGLESLLDTLLRRFPALSNLVYPPKAES